MSKVFISYSHDSPEHAERVLTFANKLRSEGIDAIIDQYEPWPEKGWPNWMLKQIREASFVIMICTEMYYKGVIDLLSAEEKKGVKYEWNLINAYFYEAGSANKRFLPVIFKKNDLDFIPDPFKGMPRFCVETVEGYEDLYRRLTNQPKIKIPELGVLKSLEVREPKTNFLVDVGEGKSAGIGRGEEWPINEDTEKGLFKVFISYSHKDEKWKNLLLNHLGVLEQEGFLEVWDDNRLTAGDDWNAEIERAINSSNVAILMITANFLTSDFICKEEVPKLLNRRRNEGVRVIPLIVKPCLWEEVKWLKSIQARPKYGQPISTMSEPQQDEVLKTLAKEIVDLLTEDTGLAKRDRHFNRGAGKILAFAIVLDSIVSNAYMISNYSSFQDVINFKTLIWELFKSSGIDKAELKKIQTQDDESNFLEKCQEQILSTLPERVRKNCSADEVRCLVVSLISFLFNRKIAPWEYPSTDYNIERNFWNIRVYSQLLKTIILAHIQSDLE